jgi:DNA-binding transcriptional regulator/RsmH inhibitor MraZ
LHHLRLDERGALKLPSAFHSYLARRGGQTAFVTSLEDGILRVYPITLWLENQEALFAARTQAARNIHFLAEDRGRDAAIDRRGRMTLHADVVELFGGVDQDVVLEFQHGRFNIYNQSAYSRRREIAKASLEEDLLALERQGLL